MKILIHTKNIDLTPSIETLVNQKVGSLEKFIPYTKRGQPPEAGTADSPRYGVRASELVEVRVEVGKPSKHHQKGPVFYAEINLKLGKQLFRATQEHMNLEHALVAARDEVERQLKKFKNKRRDLARQPLFES